MAREKKQEWPFIRKRGYPTGRVAWQVDARTSKGGERKEFGTKEEADTFVQQQRVKRVNEGLMAFSMKPEERADAESALTLLRPLERSLLEAAQFFVRHLPVINATKGAAAVVEEMLLAKEKDGASKRYLKDLRTRLKHFALGFKERKISEISTGEIDDWLRALPHSSVTRNNYRRLIGVLFSFAKQRRYCVENPTAATSKAKVIRGRPGILTVAQVEKLLVAASEQILPAIALGVFAGLRPESEVWRLGWDKLDFDARHIDISADATKNRGDDTEGAAHRFVTMQPCLIAWLKLLKKKTGPVSPTGDKYFSLLEAAREKAEISEWPHDALRHTFGSMHYAHMKNVGATMAEMGHTNPKTFFNHYRARVKPADAKKFWAIMPSKVAEPQQAD